MTESAITQIAVSISIEVEVDRHRYLMKMNNYLLDKKRISKRFWDEIQI